MNKWIKECKSEQKMNVRLKKIKKNNQVKKILK